jgi:hypothetical protein
LPELPSILQFDILFSLPFLRVVCTTTSTSTSGAFPRQNGTAPTTITATVAFATTPTPTPAATASTTTTELHSGLMRAGDPLLLQYFDAIHSVVTEFIVRMLHLACMVFSVLTQFTV